MCMVMAESQHLETSLAESENMETKTNTNDTAMERFLQRIRNDTMYELRRLQHGERPVTGQNHRQSLEAFMNKHLESRPGADNMKPNIPANVDNVEDHRPEAVVVEVQGLFEQHRVSSVLQSSEFRRHLERIIRGSISSVSHSTPPIFRSRQNTPPVQPSFAVSLHASHSQPQLASVDVREPLMRSHSPSAESITSSSSSSSASGAQDSSRNPPELAHPSGQEHRPINMGWEDINQVHREQVVQEISELFHQHLVSSTLAGEFRGALEVQLQNHLSRTDFNGPAVANAIRSLPPSGILRNDFSHLGIQLPADDADNVSVTSFSATAVPYNHSNLHLSREIQSLKAQMDEMKTMLRLSFDLQMDIQRAIRQEVAAALTQAVGGVNAERAVNTSLATARSCPVSDTHCLICLDRSTDSVLYQCGHMCLCFVCAKDLQNRGAHCPVCRAPIRDVIRAYKTNED